MNGSDANSFANQPTLGVFGRNTREVGVQTDDELLAELIDRGVEHIAQYPQLEAVRVEGVQMDRAGFSHNGVQLIPKGTQILPLRAPAAIDIAFRDANFASQAVILVDEPFE